LIKLPAEVNAVRRLLSIIILFCFPFITNAQLCTGSLGDPVVNIDFGAGKGTGTALPSALTNYNFTSALCPNDGNYTIVDTTGFCFNNTWHRLTEDHTPGDVNGRMMLVNASIEPGDFYVSTVNNLCGGTTYEFAAWIVNVLRTTSCGGNGNKPNVTFRIETTGGQLIQSFSTGDIASDFFPQWKQYGFYFQTPASVNSVVIRMKNNAPGGCGNDLALDDITFRPCGAMINVNVVGYNTNTIAICESNSVTSFTINSNLSSGYSSPAYQWQSAKNGGNFSDIPGETKSSLTVNLSSLGVYQYRLSIGETANISQGSSCRTNSTIVQITVSPLPVISAPDITDACLNSALTLTVTSGDSFQWSGPNGFSSTQSSIVFDPVQPNISGKYFVQVKTNGGCSVIDSTIIVVHNTPAVNAGNDILLCTGQSKIINATGTGTIKWTPAAGLNNTTIIKPAVNVAATTTYTLTVTDQFGCSDSDNVVVTVIRSPEANAGADKEIFEGDTVQLHGTTGGDSTSFIWSPPSNINDVNVLDPIVSPVRDINYILTVNSKTGCGSASDAAFVKVYGKLKIPNVFSPNDDGINDTWIIDGILTYPEARISIFNRYGKKVFEGNSETPWNGKFNNEQLMPGVYYYVIDTRKTKMLTGWLLLLK
jgi:gliding motility-associated-like protein